MGKLEDLDAQFQLEDHDNQFFKEYSDHFLSNNSGSKEDLQELEMLIDPHTHFDKNEAMEEDDELDQALLNEEEGNSARSSEELIRSNISDDLERATGLLLRENEKMRSNRSIVDPGSVNDMNFKVNSRFSSFDSKRSADQQVRLEDSAGHAKAFRPTRTFIEADLPELKDSPRFLDLIKVLEEEQPPLLRQASSRKKLHSIEMDTSPIPLRKGKPPAIRRNPSVDYDNPRLPALFTSELMNLEKSAYARPPRAGSARRRSSFIQGPSPDRRPRPKAMLEKSSEESDDSETGAGNEANLHMKVIKFLFRVDKLFIRAVYARKLLFLRQLKLCRSSAAQDSLLTRKRAEKFGRMRCWRNFAERLVLYPRRAFLKWKIHSDEAFLALKIPKIALMSRINYMIAIFRFKSMVNARKVEEHIRKKKRVSGARRMFRKFDELCQERNNEHKNYYIGFTSIKDKHHRTVRTEIVCNLLQSFFSRRQHSYVLLESLLESRNRRRVAIKKVFESFASKTGQAFCKLLKNQLSSRTLAEEDISYIDLWTSFSSLKRAVSLPIEAILKRSEKRAEAVSQMCCTIKSREGTFKKAAMNLIVSKSISQQTRASYVWSTLDKVVQELRCFSFRQIKFKAINGRKNLIRQMLRMLIDKQAKKVRFVMAELLDSLQYIVKQIDTETNLLRLEAVFNKLMSQRQRSFMVKFGFMVQELKMQSYLSDLHQWAIARKKTQFSSKIKEKASYLEGTLKLEEILRKLNRFNLRASLLRVKYESLALLHFGNMEKLIEHFEEGVFVPIKQRKMRIAFDSIKRRFYKVVIKRMRLARAIAQVIGSVEQAEQEPEENENQVLRSASKVGMRKVGSQRSLQLGY